MEEVAWMVHNWKKLWEISGYLHWDSELDSQLRIAIRSHGITCHDTKNAGGRLQQQVLNKMSGCFSNRAQSEKKIF
jgi:hypothetical protein